MNHIQEQVEHLEQKIYIQRKISIAVAIMLIGAIGFGFSQSRVDEIALRGLTIVDEEGRVRIVLSTIMEDGISKSCFVHFDEEGNRKFWQGTEGDIISTTYYDKEEMRQAQGVDAKLQTTWLSFFDDDQEVQSELSWQYGEEESPSLILGHGDILGVRRMLMFDQEMNVRIALDADTEGGSEIHIIDDDQVSKVVMGILANGTSGISLFDDTQEMRWSAFFEDGAIGTKLLDKNGMERTSNVILEDGDTFFSINDTQEAFDILMGSMSSGDILFCLEGEEDGSLHTSVPSK